MTASSPHTSLRYAYTQWRAFAGLEEMAAVTAGSGDSDSLVGRGEFLVALPRPVCFFVRLPIVWIDHNEGQKKIDFNYHVGGSPILCGDSHINRLITVFI